MTEQGYQDLRVADLLARIGARRAAPGGGVVAALSAAMAAGLVGMVARFSERQLAGSWAELAQQADALRARLAVLAEEDARAYTVVLQARAAPHEVAPRLRQERIDAALSAAADVPLEIAAHAVEIAELAGQLAADGNPNLSGDAQVAALIAAAAADGALALARIDLDQTGSADDRRQRAERLRVRAGALRSGCTADP